MTSLSWESLNELSLQWIHYLGTALVDAACGLMLVMCIWLALRRYLPPRWSYLLFLLVPVKVLLPLPVPILPMLTLADNMVVVEQRGTVGASELSPANPSDAWTPLRDAPSQQGVAPLASGATSTAAAEPAGAMPTWTTVWMIVWAAVVIVLLTRFARSQVRLSRLLRESIKVDLEDYAVDFALLCRRLHVRSAVRVVQSRSLDVPAVVGLPRPCIILPAGLLESLQRRQIECILAHELAHLKWRDLWVSCAERLIRIVHFANPALWLAAHFAQREREMACDDAALAATGMDRRVCGATLLHVLEFARQKQRSVAPAVALFERTGLHRQRLENIMVSRSIRRPLGPAAAFCLLLLSTILVLPNLRRAEATVAAAARSQADEQTSRSAAVSAALQAFAQLPPLEPVAKGALGERRYDVRSLRERSGDVDSLIDVITTGVLPTRWQRTGGPATIEFGSAEGQLVVSQYASAQSVIDRMLHLFKAVLDEKDARGARSKPAHPAPQAYPLAQDRFLTTTIYVVPSLLYADPLWEEARWADYDSLIRLVTTAVAPDSWDDVGGAGSVSVWPPGEVLVITQSPDNQQQIAKLFALLHSFPALNSRELAQSYDPVSLLTQTVQIALADNAQGDNAQPRPIELETRLYPLHDLLPAAMPGLLTASPRVVGGQQLGAWLWQRIMADELPQLIGVNWFATRGALVLLTTPAGHERAVRTLADLRRRLPNASAEERTAIDRELFAPAFAEVPAGGSFQIITSREQLPNRVYLYGNCQADDQLKALGPMADYVRFELINSDVTDLGLAEIAEIGAASRLAIWSDRITDAGVAQLAPLEVWGPLSLHGASLTDQVVDTILKWTRVQQIDLSHTALSDVGLRKLLQTSAARQWFFQVDVRHTNVTTATVTQLRREYPHCRIDFGPD